MLKSPPRNAGPPRVLHVITPSRMAGAEMFLVRLLRRVDSRQAIHSCVSKVSPANAEMKARGVTLETMGIGGKANVLALPRLYRAARRYQADVLHSHLSSASWWCGWLEHIGGPPSIGHVHGFTSRFWHQGQTHLIACSAAVKQHLVSVGLAPERITVLHHPVDPEDFLPNRSPSEVRSELGVSPHTPVVGTFAHLSVKKGYRELVRAAAIVLGKLPTAQFWCVGEGVLREELLRTARELGIEDRFRLFGYRRDVANLMHAVDVMCLPSHREPFGLVYLEAALAQKPVIACNAGGAPEIVVPGETGLLVPPPQNNIVPLAEAILTLLDNRGQAAAMGRRGRELAQDRFSWKNYLPRLNELYQRVCGRAAGHADHPDTVAA